MKTRHNLALELGRGTFLFVIIIKILASIPRSFRETNPRMVTRAKMADSLPPSLSLLKAKCNYFFRIRIDSMGFINWNDSRFVLFTDGEIEGDIKR